MSTKAIILIAILAIAVVAAGTWFMFGKKAEPAPATQGIGGDIYEEIAPNTADELPETNPFKAVQTNPFSQ